MTVDIHTGNTRHTCDLEKVSCVCWVSWYVELTASSDEFVARE